MHAGVFGLLVASSRSFAASRVAAKLALPPLSQSFAKDSCTTSQKTPADKEVMNADASIMVVVDLSHCFALRKTHHPKASHGDVGAARAAEMPRLAANDGWMQLCQRKKSHHHTT